MALVDMVFLLRSPRALKKCSVQKGTWLWMANNCFGMYRDWGFDVDASCLDKNELRISRTMAGLSLIRVVECLWSP